MDDIVLKGMARWPQVPAVFGWLRLDARGNWWLIQRDIPNFSEAEHGKGSLITSPPITDFIWRNFAADELGRWYWQNGPQRVFVNLERAPQIVRLVDDPEQSQAMQGITTAGEPVHAFKRALLDARDGAVYLSTEVGPACVDDRFLARLETRLMTTNDASTQLNVGSAVAPCLLVLEQVQNAAKALGFQRAPF